MKNEQNYHFFECAGHLVEEVECWSARELQFIHDNSKWEIFEKVIGRAKDSVKNAGEDLANHFPDFSKTIPKSKGVTLKKDSTQITNK